MPEINPIAAGINHIAAITRLKRITDRLLRDIQYLYAAEGSAMQFRWVAMCTLLYERGPMPINELANALQVSHSAISQLADELAGQGYAATYKDRRDRRKRVLALSRAGKDLIEETVALQSLIEAMMGELLQEAGSEFRQSVDNLQVAISNRGLVERYQALRMKNSLNDIEILDFKPELAEAFERLNRSWIEAHFEVVAADERVFRAPQQEVIFPGGAIVFARDSSGIILGTGGLVNCHDGSGEIIKMAVADFARGRNIGRLVAEALIDRARQRGMNRLYLETNSKLIPALGLYHSLGFTEIALDPDSDFDRADIRMEMALP